MRQTAKNGGYIKIKCPHCGWEYVPAEVFMPDDLTGRTKNLVKDPMGKILYVDYKEGEEPMLVQSFECEGCGRTFIVEAKLTIETKPEEEELDFGNEVVSLLGD